MAKSYRVVKVKAQPIDGGGRDVLETCLNECAPSEKVLTVFPFAQGGGYTEAFFVVFERQS
jgi:hypothetical protein